MAGRQGAGRGDHPLGEVEDRGRPSISAVLISYDEAEVIEPCLQSVAGWVDEIVVVDMHSTDGTREIVERYTSRIIEHERLSYADPARDFAFAQAAGDWIIMLDPDERVPGPLAAELLRIAREDRVDVVLIPRQDIIFSVATRSPGASDIAHPRFFRRGVLSWPPNVHGHPDLKGLRCQTLPARRPELALLHDTWRSVPMVLDKFSRYVEADVENMRNLALPFTLSRLLWASTREFLTRMFAGRAYEDGMAGLLVAVYWTVYRFSVYAAFWEAEGRSRRFDRKIARWGKWLRWLGMLPLRLERIRWRKRPPAVAFRTFARNPKREA